MGQKECIAVENGAIVGGNGAIQIMVPIGSKITEGEGDDEDTFEPCGQGSFGHRPPDTSCGVCPTGWSSYDGSVSCFECEAGKYSLNSSLGCLGCDEKKGEYSPEAGSTQCKECPTGFQSTGKECLVTAVANNLLGARNPQVQQTAKHNWSSITVQWAAEPSEGNTKDKPTLYEVQLSTENSFDPTLTVSVTAGTRSKPPQVVVSSHQLIAPNNNASGPVEIWQQEVFARVRGVTDDSGVSEWSATSDGWRVAADCSEGKYLDTDTHGTSVHKWECKTCPRGGVCKTEPHGDGDAHGVVLHKMQAAADFYRVKDAPDPHDPFHPCPYLNRCNPGGAPPQNGTDAAAAQCVPGSEGPLCAICSDGYVIRGSECDLCASSGVGLKIALAFTLLAVVVFGGCACRRRFNRARKKYGNLWRDVLRILTINVSFLQINASLPSVLSGMEFSFPQAYLDFLEEFNFVNLDVLSFFGLPCVAANIDFRVSVAAAACVPAVVVTLALLAYTLRVVSVTAAARRGALDNDKSKLDAAEYLFDTLDDSGDGSIDATEFQHLLAMLGVKKKDQSRRHSLDVMQQLAAGQEGEGDDEDGGDAPPADGVSRAQFLQMVLRNDFARIVLGSENASASTWVATVQRERIKSGYTAVVIIVFLIVHAPVSQRVFYYFHYDDVKGTTYLTSDYSIEYGSAKWAAFLPVVLLLLCGFTLLLPLYVLFKLVRNYKHLRTVHFLRIYGFLYKPFVPGAELWELHEVFRKMILTGLLICEL